MKAKELAQPLIDMFKRHNEEITNFVVSPNKENPDALDTFQKRLEDVEEKELFSTFKSFVDEEQKIMEMRKGKDGLSISAAQAIFREQDEKWDAMVKEVNKKVGEDVMMKGGYLKLHQAMFPKVHEKILKHEMLMQWDTIIKKARGII